MKRLAMIFPIALALLAPAAHALSVDMSGLTPVLTFPEPEPQTVSKNATSINR